MSKEVNGMGGPEKRDEPKKSIDKLCVLFIEYERWQGMRL